MKKYILFLLFSVLSFGQASNQMVSFNQAKFLGFTLNSSQSHGNTDQCMTKSEALAKYNLSASAMNGYASNQLVPRSTWVSGVVYYTHYFVSEAGTAYGGSCGLVNDTTPLYSDSATLVVGSVLYTNTSLTVISNGGGLEYRNTDVDKGITWGSNGVVTAIFDCNAAVVFYLHLFAAGTEFNGPASCFLLDYNTTFYSNDEELVNGSVLYTDSSLTTPYNGLNLYRHEQFTGNSFKVNTEGVIIYTWLCQ